MFTQKIESGFCAPIIRRECNNSCVAKKSDDNDALSRLSLHGPIDDLAAAKFSRNHTQPWRGATQSANLFSIVAGQFQSMMLTVMGALGSQFASPTDELCASFCAEFVYVFGTPFLLRTFLINSINSSNPAVSLFFCNMHDATTPRSVRIMRAQFEFDKWILQQHARTSPWRSPVPSDQPCLWS